MPDEQELTTAELAHLEGRALVDAEASGDDREVEAALRPRTLDELIGQERVREQLALMLGAAGYAWQGRPGLEGHPVVAAKKAGEIDAEVVDLRTLRPLDTATVLESLAKTNRLVVAEEGWPVCSIASEIIAVCMEDGFDHLDAPVMRVCNEDVPLPYAANLEKLALIDAKRIAEAARKVCYRG